MQKIYPFKFLDAYTAADKDIFFGRDAEIQDFYEMVFQTDLLLVYGASGTGKTSLIQCGLASRFQSHDWLALYIRRGTNLNTSFERIIDEAGGKNMPEENLDWLDEDWENEKPQANTKALSSLARKFKAIYLQHFRPIYLIFDQFEELYILGTKAEQAQFVETIKEILRLEQPIKVIFSIREEYLGYLYEFEKAVPELLRKKLRVEPMNLDKVRNVLLGVYQLKNTQIHLEEGKESELAEIIFDKIKGKEKTLTIQLPYLQVFLDKLYMNISQDEARKAEATFTLAALAQMGDIDNVLRDFLEEQAGKIAKTLGQQLETIWKILSPFVTLEGTKEPLNEAQLAQRLPHLDRQLISQTVKAFTDSRILRFMEDEQLYELAHDSLAAAIDRRRTAEERAIVEVSRMVKEGLTAYQKTGGLMNAENLKYIQAFLPKLSLSEAEKDFLAKSESKIRANKRLRRIVIAGLALLTVFAVGFGMFAFQQRNEAIKQEQKAKESEKNANLQKEKAQKALDDFEKAERKRKLAQIETLIKEADNFLGLGQKDIAIARLEEALQIDSNRQDVREKLAKLKP